MYAWVAFGVYATTAAQNCATAMMKLEDLEAFNLTFAEPSNASNSSVGMLISLHEATARQTYFCGGK